MHEVQLDKFKKELDMSNVSKNVAHTNQQISDVREFFAGKRGRGHMICGRGCGWGRSSSDDWLTCQLYVHIIVEWWHIFDETFTP